MILGAAIMTTPLALTRAEDLILHFIQALDRLGQNTAPPVPPVQATPLAANQLQAQAPDAFNGMSPEGLGTFLLQCQITFSSCPQNFPTKSSKQFFPLTNLNKHKP